MKRLGRCVATTEAWRTLSDELIRRAFNIVGVVMLLVTLTSQACTEVAVRFPDFELPTLDDVRLFARGAMDCVWEEDIDSWELLRRQGYDEARFTDRQVQLEDHCPCC